MVFGASVFLPSQLKFFIILGEALGLFLGFELIFALIKLNEQFKKIGEGSQILANEKLENMLCKFAL